MATGGEDVVTNKRPEIFYNTSGRYQPLTGKNSAFELIDLGDIMSDTS